MEIVPIAANYQEVQYLAYAPSSSGTPTMQKRVGATTYAWGVPIPPAKPTGTVALGGSLAEGVYRIAVVAMNILGHYSNPWKTDSDFDYLEVDTTGTGGQTISLEIPVHDDEQVIQQHIYRTRKDETSPYYYAGTVANTADVGDEIISYDLTAADSTLPTADFLEGPVSDVDALAGPFRYAAPPLKRSCAVAMDDIMFVFGEEPYSVGKADVTDGSTTVTFTDGAYMVDLFEGKRFRLIGDTTSYEIESVETTAKITLASAYKTPSESFDVDGSYEIIGYTQEVAPSAPGEPEYFNPLERFNVGSAEDGALTAGVAHYDDLVMATQTSLYVVKKGYEPGMFTTQRTASKYGCTGPNAIKSSHGALWFYNGSSVYRFYNQAASEIGQPIRPYLEVGEKTMRRHAIIEVIGDTLYLAVSVDSKVWLDTIFRYDITAGTWDEWGPFRIAHMQAAVAEDGNEYLYINSPLDSGEFGWSVLSESAYNDGYGSADYSGTIITPGRRILIVSASIPVNSLGGRFRMTSGAAEGQARWIVGNQRMAFVSSVGATTFRSKLTLDRILDDMPGVGDTYTVGAIELDLITGQLGVPDAHVRQDVKIADFTFGG